MSQQYDKTNKGALYVNGYKTSDKHPDLKGEINVNGVEYQIAGWRRDTKAGETISLSIQLKQPRTDAAPAQAPRQAPRQDYRQSDDAKAYRQASGGTSRRSGPPEPPPLLSDDGFSDDIPF